MGTPLVVDALTDQSMMPTANPIGAVRRLWADKSDDVRPRAKVAMHHDRRAQYGLPVMPCPGRSRVIGRAIMIYGRIAQ